MNTKEKFIQLTQETYPHGHEMELLDKLPNILNKDEFGNLYCQIGENPTTMFTSHLDTASREKTKVNHIINGDTIMTDGNSILGADDKAGVVVLLYLMEMGVTGLYYFFLGEERGCIGSKKLSNKHKNEPIPSINKVVSFDRRGFHSVITHQLGGRCCSNEFANNLSFQINENSKEILKKPFSYRPDDTGIYTDSAQFTSIYSECTNISVGYLNEHSNLESQNIKHLDELCRVVSLIDWQNLPTFREPTDKFEYNWKDDYYTSNYTYTYKEKSTSKTVTILDTEYLGYETKITYDTSNNNILDVKLHPGRIVKEKYKIEKLLTTLEIDFDETLWDGNHLTINNLGEKVTVLKRNELEDYITNLNDWIESEIYI